MISVPFLWELPESEDAPERPSGIGGGYDAWKTASPYDSGREPNVTYSGVRCSRCRTLVAEADATLRGPTLCSACEDVT